MKITVGKGSCGIAAGAARIYDLLADSLPDVSVTGCIGMCYLEPIVNVIDGGQINTFVKVDDTAAAEIIKYARGEENNAQAYIIPCEDAENLHAQHRIALQNCGIINPESIDEYLACEGYAAAKKCITEFAPEQVIAEVKASGLGGRGGAGFPTWFKWQAARDSKGDIKYMICNADEEIGRAHV